MVRRALFVLFIVACGGEVAGPLEDGGPGTPGDAGGSCTTNAQCGSGQMCGFDESLKCSATGKCLPAGAMCNMFQPGCSCAGQTINVACTGLPSGYATAPVQSVGAPCAVDGGGGPQFPCGTSLCSATTQYCVNTAGSESCAPLNGCTTCSCIEAMIKCSMPTCSQVADSIFVTCH